MRTCTVHICILIAHFTNPSSTLEDRLLISEPTEDTGATGQPISISNNGCHESKIASYLSASTVCIMVHAKHAVAC